MSKDKAPGPENKQACQVMGNSEEAWEKFYDTNFSVRECQLGVDATASEWREAMLQKGAPSVYERVD